MQKKILIIARYFLPYHISLGGVIRILKLSEFLLGNDFEVHILAAGGRKINYFGYEELVNKFKIHYIDDFLNAWVTNKDYKNVNNRRNNGGIINSFARIIKKIVSEFSVPDEGVFFVNKYFNKALEIINGHGIRSVLISSPPHSMQIVGLKLKEKLSERLNLIVDYRDSWNTSSFYKKHVFPFTMQSRNIERKVLRAADNFTYVSEAILKKINGRYFDISKKALLVMNGYDTKMITPFSNKHRNDCLTIGYFGTLSNIYHKPDLFFNALSKLNKKLKIVFYGSSSINSGHKEALRDIIEVKGWVSHESALSFMQEMDLLLIIYSEKKDADEVVTGKLFEYVFAGKPILVVAPKNTAAAKIVKENNLGYYIDLYDEQGMIRKLNEICGLWEKNELITYNAGDLREFSRQFQFSKLLRILD